MNIWSTVRKILGLKKKRIDPQGGSDVLKKRKKEVGIPKEVLDKLPPGVKVQRVEIGPRQIIRLVIYGVLVWWLVTTMQGALSSESVMSVPLSTAIEAIRKDNSAKITVMDNQILVEVPSESKILVSSKEGNSSMAEILQREGISLENIEFEVQNRQGWKLLGEIFTLVLTLGLPLFVIYMVFMRQGKGGGMGGGIFGFGKSTAKLFVKGKQKVRFGDVAGVKEAKDDLMEVVDFLKNPTKYSKMGARVPKGVLLIGPSGVGKTLLARAVAGEANVPFYSMAGSEFMEMLVGVGASVVGDTPVLVKEGEEIRLKPMAEVVDKYYGKEEAGGVKKVKGLETLGFEKAENKFWGTSSKKTEKFVFSHSAWKKVEGVLRHKVNEIYEIEFLDGKLRTTGDHSVFVRKQGWIEAKRVDELEPGDILVNLPMKTRKWDYDLKKTIHKVKAHVFGRDENKWLDVWQDNQEEWVKYEKAIENPANLYQKELAAEVGVCQMTVSNWQRGIHVPRAVSKRLMKLKVPERVRVSEDLMWLLGIYTAEGRGTNNLELTFGVREDELISKTAWLMKKVFGLGKPVLKATETNSMKVIYYSAHLGRFFAKWCGNGSHNKHIPELLWRLPKGYFLAYLKGWMEGDGYEYKSGKLTGVSVSRRLVRELAWLASMHGIKVGIREELVKGGRVIRSKALPDSRVWKLIIGKTSNPDMISKYPNQFKKCYVRKVTKRKFEGYVYDLCGVENEGFFGGEKPMLLHNSRVRDLFTTAKKAGKAIIFIDEIDAIGRMRGGMDGGHGEREQTLNQILVEMDGFEPNQTIIVLAATNRGDLLDPALMRPGRFDRRVMLEMPDIDDRIAILKIHAKGKPFSRVKWEDVAKATVGFSGADLENMLNEAAIGAARVGKKTISMRDINEASLKVKLGAEKRRRLTEKDKKMTAYHEAGHAVVNYALKLDPVERISVVSRGMALGFTLTPPKRDRVHETKTRLVKQMAMAMGGRAAEELEFGDMTTGAAADIAQSTRIARRMVTEWGMSDLGPVNLGPEFDTENMSMGYLRTDETSETMRAKVDEEIGKLVDEAIGKARRVLKEHKKELDEVAELLVKKESLERKEFENVMSR